MMVSTLFIILLPLCLALPRERRQTFGGGMDPSFGPGFGDPASPFNVNGNPMARSSMDAGMFGSSFTRGQGRGLPYNGYGSSYGGPRGYSEDMGAPHGFGGEGRSAYVYEPRQRYGGESMYEPAGRFGGNYMGGDQFIGSDPNIAGGMSGMGGMGGMGGGLGGLASFGGGMGGDGMEDMARMQAEMQQMQQQLKQAPPPNVATPKGNTSTNVEKIGDNLLVTNQTRFVDNNDGLTQGFFQEFHIFPGMETTTAASGGSASSAQLEQTTGRPAIAGVAGKHNEPVVNPAAIFGFTPPDNFFNPRKVVPILPTASSSTVGMNEVSKQHHPVKKAFSSEKFEVIGDNFNRAFDAL